jgi:Fungal specific transcription factor domain
MPVISRSQLSLTSPSPNQALLNTPVHLLAAIYASALPFKAHDQELIIFGLYDDSLCDRLWRIVYEIILQEIHTPHLSVLQACLLYLQRMPLGSQSALADSPFVWSFLGSTVGLAASLGLHLEPRPWGIPTWEKRLRRRLWWAVYNEDKWRSLLIARPPFIRREEWDVKNLDGLDFAVDRLDDADIGTYFKVHFELEPEDGAIFKSFTDLAQIVDDMYQTF